jgi:hypothetical protein
MEGQDKTALPMEGEADGLVSIGKSYKAKMAQAKAEKHPSESHTTESTTTTKATTEETLFTTPPQSPQIPPVGSKRTKAVASNSGESRKPPKERHELPSPTKRVKGKDTTSSTTEQEKEKDTTSSTTEQEKEKDTTSSTMEQEERPKEKDTTSSTMEQEERPLAPPRSRGLAHLEKDFSSLRRPVPGRLTPSTSPKKGIPLTPPPPPKFALTIPKGTDELGFKQYIPSPKELAALEKESPTKYSVDPLTDTVKQDLNSVPKHHNETSPPPPEPPLPEDDTPKGDQTLPAVVQPADSLVLHKARVAASSEQTSPTTPSGIDPPTASQATVADSQQQEPNYQGTVVDIPGENADYEDTEVDSSETKPKEAAPEQSFRESY